MYMAIRTLSDKASGWPQSVRMAIHFFVNFEVFRSLYLSKNLPDKHQT